MVEQLPIYNPIIPFTGVIFGGLQDGKMVIIQGQVPGHAKRFAVDFQCGSSVKPRADVAFHFNLRYDEGAVVCNTLERECWGREERASQIPTSRGSYFEMIFNVRSYCYQVSVNGKHFIDFNHRLSYGRVDTLKISGDVQVNAITFRSPNVPPAYAPPAYAPVQAFNLQSVFGASPAFYSPSQLNKGMNSTSQVTVSSPVVPYQAYLGSIRPQQKIKVVGTVKPKPYRFTINMKAGYSDNIALHINQRFDENAVVRNSRINQNWGAEERDVPFLPFVPGQTFEVLIVIQPNCYKVSVNGRHLFNYNHRLQPLNQIDQLEVTGDISLSLVQY
ncbi:galectin-9B-like isoform X2 [Scyliorhinus canicula]|uniref:galectin-9B-like isoform X2 n=1 Tax=Scyliorhinus canicula TaxID=7830 RepID=UPI0018F6DFBE|nr:galectin-9B-like isoform X2 [Scyliorhinus canicula]